MTAGPAGLGDLHEELRAVARDILGSPAPGGAPDAGVAAEAGWLGLEVPGELGGAGATFAETAVVLEEVGRAAIGAPWWASTVLGVGMLEPLVPTARRDELLGRIAAGASSVAVAVPGDVDDPLAPPAFSVERVPGGARVTGRAAFVVEAPGADRLLLPATDAGGGPLVVEVDRTTPGIDVVDQPLVDATRGFGLVTASAAEVPDAALLAPASGALPMDRLADRVAVALACDSLGVARVMLEATVAYAGERHQFGRPIGSFQAVKHACADMAVAVAVSERLVAAGVGAVAAGTPDAWVAASMAASHVTTAAVEVAGAAMQLHGGLGYTWESGIHRYLKRAALNRSLFGSPAAHRRRLARRYAAD